MNVARLLRRTVRRLASWKRAERAGPRVDLGNLEETDPNHVGCGFCRISAPAYQVAQLEGLSGLNFDRAEAVVMAAASAAPSNP